MDDKLQQLARRRAHQARGSALGQHRCRSARAGTHAGSERGAGQALALRGRQEPRAPGGDASQSPPSSVTVRYASAEAEDDSKKRLCGTNRSGRGLGKQFLDEVLGALTTIAEHASGLRGHLQKHAARVDATLPVRHLSIRWKATA